MKQKLVKVYQVNAKQLETLQKHGFSVMIVSYPPVKPKLKLVKGMKK